MSLVANALAAGTGNLAPIKKAEQVAAPATPKSMPKVDKPKSREEKLADCLKKGKRTPEVCNKRYGAKK